MEEINKNSKLGYEHSTKEYAKLLEQVKKLKDIGINVRTDDVKLMPIQNQIYGILVK